MLIISNRHQQGYLKIEDLKKFPYQHLLTIDRLWLKHSQGRFGFSVQTPIWVKVGGKPNPDWKAWCRFGEQIGWFVNDRWLSWNDLTFNLNAPAGHLPRGGAFIGWGLGDFWTGCPMLSCLNDKFINPDM